jgi:hypothetical protein
VNISRCGLSAFVVASLLVAAADRAVAQNYRVLPRRDLSRPAPARPSVVDREDGRDQNASSQVSVELIFDARFGVGLHAQEWSQEFQRLGYPVRIRRGIAGDKPELKETTLGGERRVTAIGQLDRAGDLIFPERRFSRSDAGQLGEWLEELDKYGVQGAPNGQPVWGLDETQFGALYAALSRKVGTELEGLPLRDAVARIGLPDTYPVRFTSKAETWLASEYSGQPKIRQSVEGLSIGTALAMLVGDYGLGFRPQRQPDGSIELVVDPLKEKTSVWPVGWEPKESRQRTFPTLFELVPVDLDDVKLTDLLHAVSVKTGVPMHFDHYRIEASGIKLDEIVVQYPPRTTSWSLLLSGVTYPHRLTRELRIDERGQAFVWITTLKIGRLGRPENDE